MSSTQPNQPGREYQFIPVRVRKPPSPSISNDVWEAHKDDIISLYIAQRHTAKEVVKRLTSEHFAPSERQLHAQVVKWGFRKNVSRRSQQTQPTAPAQLRTENTNPLQGDQDTSNPINALNIGPTQLTGLNGMNTQGEPLEAPVVGSPLMLHNETEQSFGCPEPQLLVVDTAFDSSHEDFNGDFYSDSNILDSLENGSTVPDDQGVEEADVRHEQHDEEWLDWLV